MGVRERVADFVERVERDNANRERERAQRHEDDQLADELRDALVARGFALRRDDYMPSSFGNRIRILRSGDLNIWIVKDRGPWDISVDMAAGERMPISLWRVLLDEGSPDALTSFSQETAYLVSRLDSLVALAADRPAATAANARLAEIARAVFEARFVE